MSHSIKCAKVTDWLLELIPVWEVPVTAAMLQVAIPEYSKPTITHALKYMTMDGVLYTEAKGKDQVFYFPVDKRPVCVIQQIICKGFARAKL